MSDRSTLTHALMNLQGHLIPHHAFFEDILHWTHEGGCNNLELAADTEQLYAFPPALLTPTNLLIALGEWRPSWQIDHFENHLPLKTLEELLNRTNTPAQFLAWV